MKLLLDTCAFLWLTAEPDKLSRKAVAAVNDPDNELLLSDTSIWEVVLKHSAGKLPLPEPPRIWIPKQIDFFHMLRVAISLEALVRSGESFRESITIHLIAYWQPRPSPTILISFPQTNRSRSSM